MDGQADGEKLVFDIPRRKKSSVPSQETNGDSAAPHTNGGPVSDGKRKGEGDLELQNGTKKRPAADSLDERPIAKRGKIGGPATDDDLIVIDDAADGAIVIDDD